MKSTIPGACLLVGLPEIMKIESAQPPSWGWGWGLSFAIPLLQILFLDTQSCSKATSSY